MRNPANPYFLEVPRVAVAGVALAVGAAASAYLMPAETFGPGTVAVPEGTCLPITTSVELRNPGETFDVGLQDLSVNPGVAGGHVEDALTVEARGSEGSENVTTVSFSGEDVQVTVLDGVDFSGTMHEDDEHIVDVEGLRDRPDDERDTMDFLAQEADKVVSVRVTPRGIYGAVARFVQTCGSVAPVRAD